MCGESGGVVCSSQPPASLSVWLFKQYSVFCNCREIIGCASHFVRFFLVGAATSVVSAPEEIVEEEEEEEEEAEEEEHEVLDDSFDNELIIYLFI